MIDIFLLTGALVMLAALITCWYKIPSSVRVEFWRGWYDGWTGKHDGPGHTGHWR